MKIEKFVCRASIEVDKYVSGEDYLKYDTSAEDAPSDISGDNTTASDTDTTDDWLGWDEDNGVLTLLPQKSQMNGILLRIMMMEILLVQ